MTPTFHVVDPDDAEAVADALRLVQAFDDEISPGDPPMGRDEYQAAYLRYATDRVRFETLVARNGETPIATVNVGLLLDPDNRHLLDLDGIYVTPAARRQGVATAMLAEVGRRYRPQGYTDLSLWTPAGDGEDFCVATGLERKIAERCSRLRVADLDPEQQREWAVNEPATEAGYRLVAIDGRCPDELLPALCTAKDSMIDQPMGSLEIVHAQSTPESIRASEAASAAVGNPQFRLLAVGPDGSGAGLTTLQVNRHRPMLASQGDTGVVAAHRGRGIGRWLKAQNLARARAAHPEVAIVETYNAADNPWMLDINVKMGFAPHVAWMAYGGPVAAV